MNPPLPRPDLCGGRRQTGVPTATCTEAFSVSFTHVSRYWNAGRKPKAGGFVQSLPPAGATDLECQAGRRVSRSAPRLQALSFR